MSPRFLKFTTKDLAYTHSTKDKSVRLHAEPCASAAILHPHQRKKTVTEVDLQCSVVNMYKTLHYTISVGRPCFILN